VRTAQLRPHACHVVVNQSKRVALTDTPPIAGFSCRYCREPVRPTRLQAVESRNFAMLPWPGTKETPFNRPESSE